VRQAAHQFLFYTGREAPMDVMREIVRRKLGPVRG
jgi:shikimate 5-dehydrogenase